MEEQTFSHTQELICFAQNNRLHHWLKLSDDDALFIIQALSVAFPHASLKPLSSVLMSSGVNQFLNGNRISNIDHSAISFNNPTNSSMLFSLDA